MLVNRILKHGNKSFAYQIIYRAIKNYSTKEKNKSTIYFKFMSNIRLEFHKTKHLVFESYRYKKHD